ncbi:hypothetical protein [Phaeodactylibacter luteus]|uniref:DUF4834 family protein n=1 Tax=Phaeodactylibacter luteus TaxID=1564516 RepID=A0A5C6S179_9BACT|nr:hypothetical protein [Phaeodactylibacter luteus]TXB67975.1 hypothetical protein FRY97_03775 [Phaeodactylibacter luteus]
MVKIFLTGLIVYVLYKYFFKDGHTLGGSKQEPESKIRHSQSARPQRGNDDYAEDIDYEEMD